MIGDSELLLLPLLQRLIKGSCVDLDLISVMSEKWLFLKTEWIFFSLTSHFVADI